MFIESFIHSDVYFTNISFKEEFYFFKNLKKVIIFPIVEKIINKGMAKAQ